MPILVFSIGITSPLRGNLTRVKREGERGKGRHTCLRSPSHPPPACFQGLGIYEAIEKNGIRKAGKKKAETGLRGPLLLQHLLGHELPWEGKGSFKMKHAHGSRCAVEMSVRSE